MQSPCAFYVPWYLNHFNLILLKNDHGIRKRLMHSSLEPCSEAVCRKPMWSCAASVVSAVSAKSRYRPSPKEGIANRPARRSTDQPPHPAPPPPAHSQGSGYSLALQTSACDAVPAPPVVDSRYCDCGAAVGSRAGWCGRVF